MRRRARRRAAAARTAALSTARIRVAVGLALTLLPRTAWSRLVGHEVGPASVLAVRMAGVRDLALGLGAVFAGRHDGAALRGWTEAGALADVGDAVAGLTSSALPASRRILMPLSAGAAAVAALKAAREL